MFFYGGIRVSTIVMLVLLVFVPLARRDWRALAGVMAFLIGFEAAWEGTIALLYLTGLEKTLSAGLAVGWPVMAGVAWVIVAWQVGLRPSRWWLAATAALWVLWLALGFHTSPDGGPITSWTDELVNVGAKTAWGMAWLVAQWKHARPSAAAGQPAA